MSGGDLGYREHSCCSVLSLRDEAELAVSGGVVHGWSVLQNQVLAEISGGTLTGELSLEGQAQLRLSGGFLDGPVRTDTGTHLEMEGSHLAESLTVGGTAILRGGEVRDQLVAEFTGDIEIVGGGFEVWGEPVPPGELVEPYGRLTGVLANGDPLDVYFERREAVVGSQTLQGRITLVPEPARSAMLAAGVLFLLLAPAPLSRPRDSSRCAGSDPRCRARSRGR